MNAGILDTPHERDFDEIVDYVARLCDAPIALITLVEDERQWFKAARGFELRETPVTVSICFHALAEDELLEIPDTAQDPRTAENPFCTGPDAIRFYAGALLRLEGGTPIGTLCVLDRRPRRLTEAQRETLILLARQVVRQIELREALTVQRRLRSEIDHRVKNSLQMVASYLRLQSRGAGEEARELLRLAEQRVAAIVALHAALNETGSAGVVQLDGYLRRIASLIDGSLPPNVRIEADLAPAALGAERAAAAGLIVNEFAANSVKHAFPDDRPGLVQVTGTLVDSRYLLTLNDDGIGLRKGEQAPQGLGLLLIDAAARQLQAEVERPRTSSGSALRLSFRPAALAPQPAD